MKKNKSQANVQTNAGLHFTIDNFEVTTLEKFSDNAFSSIYKCVDMTGALHILKIYQARDKDFIVSTIRGIVIHSKLSNHHNIIRLEGYVSSDRSIRTLMEYCDNSLINEMGQFTNVGFKTEKIAEIFSSVLAAVKFLHSQSPPVIHRGIIPKNVLCQKGVWKLTDFGFATTRVYRTENNDDLKQASDDYSHNTTPEYRSPEIVDLYRGEVIDTKSDIWALGCFLFRLCTFKEAFPGGKSLQILNGKYQWSQQWSVDEYFKEVVERCLNPNPALRPTASELDDDFRRHFGLSPTPEAGEKAVRMTDNSYNLYCDKTETSSNSIHSFSARVDHPQMGQIIQNHQQTHHITLDYNSYTRALLRMMPPDTDEQSDESEIEVVEEKKEKKDENISNNEKLDQELNELNIHDEEEDADQRIKLADDEKAKGPSVIELNTTIEKLIEFGDEPTLIKNTVNQFSICDNNNEDDNKNQHQASEFAPSILDETNSENKPNNNDLLCIEQIDDDGDNGNHHKFGQNAEQFGHHKHGNEQIKHHNFIYEKPGNDLFNRHKLSHDKFSYDKLSTEEFGHRKLSHDKFSLDQINDRSIEPPKMIHEKLSNDEIFTAFDNYNKNKSRNEILSLGINDSSSSSLSKEPISIKNKSSFSTGNINQIKAGNQILDSGDDIDDIFGGPNSSTMSKVPDYKSMYEKDPTQLKMVLMKLDNLSLSTALYRFMLTDKESLFILGLVRESGIKGTRILSHIPVLPSSSFNNYLELRKQFVLNFPMFEGNFSLFDFAQQNKEKPPPTPGNPPISIEVAQFLDKILDLFLKAFADNQKESVLIEDGFDAFQTLSYIIAKLKIFNVKVGFLKSTIIPMYDNMHRRMLSAFTRAQININFPSSPFNFDDETIVKKLRAPKHKDIYEQSAENM